MTLKWKLLLGILPITIISLLSLGFLAYSKMGTQREHDVVVHLEATFQRLGTLLQSYIQNATSIAESLGQGFDRFNDVVPEQAEQENHSPAQSLENYISVLKANIPNLLAVELYSHSSSGQCTRTLYIGAGETDNSDLCHITSESSAGVGSDFIHDAQSKDILFRYAQQSSILDSYDPDSGTEEPGSSTMVLVFSANALAESILAEQKNSTARLLILNELGQHLYHEDKHYVGVQAPLGSLLIEQVSTGFTHDRSDEYHGLHSVALKQTDNAVVNETQPPLNLGVETHDHDATEVHTPQIPALVDAEQTLQHTQMLHKNLYVAAILPREELKVAKNAIAPTVAGVTLTAIAATTVLLWIMISVLIIMPIQRLRRDATLLGSGQRPVQRKIKRSDEIGQLEKSFHDMSAQLATTIDELRESNRTITELANQDALTNLPNRRHFVQTLHSAMREIKHADSDEKIAILFLDVDEFKRINDLLGHKAGDDFLSAIGERLRKFCDITNETESLSVNAMAARLGGDEFVVSISGQFDDDDIRTHAQTLQVSLKKPITVANQTFHISTSIGIAIFPDHATSEQQLLKCADIAMYEIKLESKNGICIFNNKMASQIEETARLEFDLRNAIERNELYLAYQPQISAVTGQVLGLEALLRWRHPAKGNIPPDVFIPIAEKFSLIGKIGLWVLNEACRQWSEWQQAGFAPERIAVNVSRRQLTQADLREQIENALTTYNVPPSALELELTESCMLEAPVQTVELIQSLRKLGVRIALDDFGTGYSSLSSLAILPIDTIKLDRSFVSNVDKIAGNNSIVSAIIQLATELQLETVAEGVETVSEQQVLQDKQCDVLQGYLLSKPLDVADAEQWLTAQLGKPENRKTA